MALDEDLGTQSYHNLSEPAVTDPMPNTTPSIVPLPPEVAAKFKSSTAITSLSMVVLGLLANSLDAHARRVDINVDLRKGAASVEDDGNGIPPKEFGEDGGLGKPYREMNTCSPFEALLTNCRYIQDRQPEFDLWEGRSLPDLCSRFVNSNHHIPSQNPPATCDTHSASLKASRKVDTGAFAPASIQP